MLWRSTLYGLDGESMFLQNIDLFTSWYNIIPEYLNVY